jgi:hypothetical protein
MTLETPTRDGECLHQSHQVVVVGDLKFRVSLNIALSSIPAMCFGRNLSCTTA